jgi:branched-chain amino acid transport system ATP-binding protein
MSVFENVRCALLWPLKYRYSFWHRCNRRKTLNQKTHELLKKINMADRRDIPAGELAYAEQRALEVGITIAGGADVILLDEPTSGMSSSETERAVNLIRSVTEGKTLVVVEHDMSVVFDLADRISVLVYGEIIATDVPDHIRSNADVQEAYLGKEVA